MPIIFIINYLNRNNNFELSYNKPDPLLVASRYKDEYVILLCALFAYGKASLIVKFLDSLDFSLLEQSAADVELFDGSGFSRLKNGFIVSYENHLKDEEGKIVLVQFWATYCTPCRVEMPSMNNLIKKLEEDKVPFKIIAVNMGETKEEVQKFVDGAWELVPNYEGVIYYMPDKSEHTFNQVGVELPEGATLIMPESTTSELITEQRLEINNAFNQAMGQITAGYPVEEIASWTDCA